MEEKAMVDKGNYCIVIEVKEDCDIRIGARGIVHFTSGYYVYVGSALNSLSKRIERHLSDSKRKHWHADYLLLNKNTQIMEVIYTYCTKKIECSIACEILKSSDDYIELFGCSDCNCISHLYYFREYCDAIKSSIASYEKNSYKAYTYLSPHTYGRNSQTHQESME
ncbi:MAG: endonuclease [Methanosphaera sp. rholeuAM270]|nr:MAG: endonuclease [Methanosphaera sp. rholeuAM270]